MFFDSLFKLLSSSKSIKIFDKLLTVFIQESCVSALEYFRNLNKKPIIIFHLKRNVNLTYISKHIQIFFSTIIKKEICSATKKILRQAFSLCNPFLLLLLLLSLFLYDLHINK